jgi:hypothetical protein
VAVVRAKRPQDPIKMLRYGYTLKLAVAVVLLAVAVVP